MNAASGFLAVAVLILCVVLLNAGVTHKADDPAVEVLRVELEQEELTCEYRKAVLDRMHGSPVPAKTLMDAQYEYDMAKLRVKSKQTAISSKVHAK